MLRSDDVGLPEIFIVGLTIPSTVLGCQVVDVVEFIFMFFKESFYLSVVTHIAALVVVPVVVQKINGEYFVSTSFQFMDQVSANKTCPSSYKNILSFDLNSSFKLDSFIITVYYMIL